MCLYNASLTFASTKRDKKQFQLAHVLTITFTHIVAGDTASHLSGPFPRQFSLLHSSEAKSPQSCRHELQNVKSCPFDSWQTKQMSFFSVAGLWIRDWHPGHFWAIESSEASSLCRKIAITIASLPISGYSLMFFPFSNSVLEWTSRRLSECTPVFSSTHWKSLSVVASYV